MAKLKLLARAIGRIPTWVYLLYTASFLGWSHLQDVRRDQQRQQQNAQTLAIEIEVSRLESEWKRIKITSAAYQKNGATAAQIQALDAQTAAFEKKLKALKIRLDPMKHS